MRNRGRSLTSHFRQQFKLSSREFKKPLPNRLECYLLKIEELSYSNIFRKSNLFIIKTKKNMEKKSKLRLSQKGG